MDLATMIKGVLDIGLQALLLLVFVWYFMKRDKDREESLVNEKIRQREEFRKQKEAVESQLENYKVNAREKEALLMSENAKREELIRKESEKRETLLRQEAEKRETALMAQLDAMSGTMKEISQSMDGINRSMDGINRTVEGVLSRMEMIEHKVAAIG